MTDLKTKTSMTARKAKKTMTAYIASSWKNQHAVEMLTSELREIGFNVISWVENNFGENHNHVTKKFDFNTWVNSKESDQSFEFDTEGAMNCDAFIYVGPAGKDAAAECGMAYASGVPMFGLWAKGEDFGLMRKMFSEWFERYTELLKILREYYNQILPEEKEPQFVELSKPCKICKSPEGIRYNDGVIICSNCELKILE